MSKTSPTSPVEIVVCVHNSFDDVERCLSSVKATMRDGDRLVIVDDGSEEKTMLLCQSESNEIGPDRCTLLRRKEGSGFCKAANAGLAITTLDTVIILNSDTVVTGDWIERITTCMASNWQIGIVGPISNAGGWQSIPELPSKTATSNQISNDLETISEIHSYCKNFGQLFNPPIVEQINGSCFAVSRDVLNVIGYFDEDNFPMGYGEENDFTFRAMDAGFLCVVALDCFVFHSKTKSYTNEARVRLSKEGQERLHELHGKERVMSAVKQTQEHLTLKSVRAMARKTFAVSGWLDCSQ